MLRSLRAAERAMNVHVTRINALANNLANVDAAGFKQVLTHVTERGATVRSVEEPARTLDNEPKRAKGGTAAWSPQRELDLRSAIDLRPGALRETGRQGDLALAGDGFFVVQTPEGERYTRNGRFAVDRDGRLVTASGAAVLGGGGPLEIPGGQFVVQRDGSVVVEGNVLGRLQVVRFSEPSRLEHKGNALLAAPRDQVAEPMPPESVQVVQGSLEASNVDPIRALVDMIAAQRAFEIESRVMQAGDESLEKAVNSLPSTR